MKMSEENKVRLNKYMSEIGYCSRRAADTLIEEGRIKVNGVIPELGTKVNIDDQIAVDDKVIQSKRAQGVYIALNKPRGIVCTTDTKREKKNIVDFINYPERIFPIGRLDKDSEGLILLTNDGDIVNKVLRARYNHEKEYIVKVDMPISDAFLEQMRTGVPILDTVTNPCEVEKISVLEFKIILTQGLNRQIRRMCEYCGFTVMRLKRIRIMHIHLDTPLGKYRHLTEEEVAIIKAGENY